MLVFLINYFPFSTLTSNCFSPFAARLPCSYTGFSTTWSGQLVWPSFNVTLRSSLLHTQPPQPLWILNMHESSSCAHRLIRTTALSHDSRQKKLNILSNSSLQLWDSWEVMTSDLEATSPILSPISWSALPLRIFPCLSRWRFAATCKCWAKCCQEPVFSMSAPQAPLTTLHLGAHWAMVFKILFHSIIKLFLHSGDELTLQRHVCQKPFNIYPDLCTDIFLFAMFASTASIRLLRTTSL